MVRVFDRNMFIMLFSVMIGVILITYFLADIVNQSKLESLTTEHIAEIETIEEMNIKFTNGFLESSVLLDTAREFRAFGNYHFDLAILFYNSALSEKNISLMKSYINNTIDNCTKAMPKYFNSHLNFESSSDFFNNTKKHTTYSNYLKLLDLYVNLTKSGSRLTLLRYNASKYLKYLAENVTNDEINLSALMDLFNESMMIYDEELGIYNEYEEEIDEYDIVGFDPNREPT